MKIITNSNIKEISNKEWNALVKDKNPFISHEFLLALERNNCATLKFGWKAKHITIYDNDQLVAASPLYQKTNGYGELVFDNLWSDAYERTGRSYYPKLVCAIPYTPATGQRLLAKSLEYSTELILKTIEKAKEDKLSSIHWLFPDLNNYEQLSEMGLITREDIQFHWHNKGYSSFHDFLGDLTSRKRKMIKKERLKVINSGFEFETIHGSKSNSTHWSLFQVLYESTFQNKYGVATLNQSFFEEIADTLGDKVILVMVKKDGKYVAGALSFKSENRLYGRHWGTLINSDSLHFETCYYQGIDYCIKNNLNVFEPGAQGEYKMSRGFLPVSTHSAHWIADKEFRHAINEHTKHEKEAISHYKENLIEHTPFHK